MMNGEEILRLEFPTVETIRWEIIDAVVSSFAGLGLRVSLNEYEFRLVIDEALTNAMEHGNRWDPGKRILVCGYARRGHITITIKDEGDGFRYEDYLVYVPSLRMRGRGIHIIRHYCEPEWNGKGNAITLKIALGPEGRELPGEGGGHDETS
jgi:anti-sigma regulatory factor (Ser/Thr protein kinase)